MKAEIRKLFAVNNKKKSAIPLYAVQGLMLQISAKLYQMSHLYSLLSDLPMYSLTLQQMLHQWIVIQYWEMQHCRQSDMPRVLPVPRQSNCLDLNQTTFSVTLLYTTA